MEIKKLAKELCDKSGCHHKCLDTDKCVVEDEAAKLINKNKPMTIGEIIKQKRIERGLSQRAMAKELGVANMVLCWWEKDHNLPSLLSLWDLADYFGCSMDELCGRTFVPTSNELVPKENELPSALTNEEKVSVKGKCEGEWIKHCNTYECSVCKEELFIEYAEDYDAIADWEFNFCPFCGARMKGGE